MARLTETVKLPSNNVFYDEDFPKELTIQNMTIDEESYIYGSSGDKALDQIIQSCIKEDIDINKLIASDKYYLLVKIRILTYGPNYPVVAHCPKCGEFEYNVDLTTLPVDTISSREEVEKEITLPVSKDIIKIKIPNGYELDEIEKENKRQISRFGRNPGKAGYIANLIASIDTINGEELTFGEMYAILSEYSGKDSSYLKKELNKIALGYDTNLTIECSKCQKELEMRLPMTADFFRTEFDD